MHSWFIVIFTVIFLFAFGILNYTHSEERERKVYEIETETDSYDQLSEDVSDFFVETEIQVYKIKCIQSIDNYCKEYAVYKVIKE